jgi:hypothetical protein
VGTLSASAFTTGSQATSAEHRIIYDAATGNLFFDADGSGAGAQVQFAILTPGLTLTNANFVVADPLAYAAAQPQGGQGLPEKAAAPLDGVAAGFDAIDDSAFTDISENVPDALSASQPRLHHGEYPLADGSACFF